MLPNPPNRGVAEVTGYAILIVLVLSMSTVALSVGGDVVDSKRGETAIDTTTKSFVEITDTSDILVDTSTGSAAANPTVALSINSPDGNIDRSPPTNITIHYPEGEYRFKTDPIVFETHQQTLVYDAGYTSTSTQTTNSAPQTSPPVQSSTDIFLDLYRYNVSDEVFSENKTSEYTVHIQQSEQPVQGLIRGTESEPIVLEIHTHYPEHWQVVLQSTFAAAQTTGPTIYDGPDGKDTVQLAIEDSTSIAVFAPQLEITDTDTSA